MKYPNLEPLIEAAGTDTSTVYKVIGHKSGVASETREQILRMAVDMGLARVSEPSDLYIILPQVPDYFWGKLCAVIQKELADTEWRVSFHFCATTRDFYVIDHYLQDARKSGARAVLIGTHLHDSSRVAIEQLCENGPVFFICEPQEQEDCYYFGTDFYTDGILLARRISLDFPTGNVILTGDSPERAAGFRAVFRGNVRVLPFDDIHLPSAPARFARALAEQAESTAVDALVCLDGITDKVCLAVSKLNRSLPCYGMECSAHVCTYLDRGLLTATLCQDLDTIAHLCITSVLQYLSSGIRPTRRATLVPSLLLEKNSPNYK